HTLGQMIALAFSREAARGYIVGKSRKRPRDNLLQIGILADELGLMPECESQEIGKHQYLAVAMGACADTDGRDRDPVGYDPGNLGGYALQYDGEGACALERQRVFDQFARSVDRFTLDSVSAHSQQRLGTQTYMSHHRNLGRNYGLHDFSAICAAFYFNGLGPAFFYEPDSGFDRPFGSVLIRTKWHVADHQRPFDCTLHSSGCRDHLVQCNGQRAVISEHGVCETVSDQNQIEAGFVNQPGAG